MTSQLTSALAKVYANNRVLMHLTVAYRHAFFEDCLKIADNLIYSMKAGLNNLRTFNGFNIYDYVFYRLFNMNLCEKVDDFDFAHYDPLYSALVVKAICLHPESLRNIVFNPNITAIEEFNLRNL